MTAAPTLNENAAVERHTNTPGGLDLFTAGAGVAAAADSSAVVQWAQRLAVVRSAVELVIETPFVPASYWPLPRGVKLKDFPTPYLVHPSEDAESYGHRRRIATATATLAALHGEQYGWQPGQSWRLLYVVHGRVGIGYEGVAALLRGAGYRLDVIERSATRAEIALTAPGGQPKTYEFTMADAELAGYVPGKGPNTGTNSWKGNDKYLTDPKTMLLARDITIAARVEAAHVIAGMPVVELMDDEPQVAEPVQLTAAPVEKPAGAGSARLRELVQAAPSVVEVDGPGGPSAGPMDEATWRKINARFVQLGRGVNGPGQQNARLYVIGRIVDRTVARGSDLNAAEGDLVLSTLQGTTSERVDQLLAERNRVEPGEQPRGEVVAGPPLPDEQSGETGYTEPGDVDEDLGDDVPEPGEDEGRPAALEGVADPWAGQ